MSAPRTIPDYVRNVQIDAYGNRDLVVEISGCKPKHAELVFAAV